MENERELAEEQTATEAASQNTMDLLSMTVGGRPLYIMVNGMNADSHDRKRYYEKQICPAQILQETIMVGYKGNPDPHGVLKYHTSLSHHEILEKFRDADIGLVDFSRLNAYSVFEDYIREQELTRQINPEVIIKEHLPKLLFALEMYMGKALSVQPNFDSKGKLLGYQLVYKDGEGSEEVQNVDIPNTITPLDELIDPF